MIADSKLSTQDGLSSIQGPRRLSNLLSSSVTSTDRSFPIVTVDNVAKKEKIFWGYRCGGLGDGRTAGKVNRSSVASLRNNFEKVRFVQGNVHVVWSGLGC